MEKRKELKTMRNRTGMMMITGNSIEELEMNLEMMMKAISSGATMGVGGKSLADVEKGLDALCDATGYSPTVEVEVEETVCCCCKAKEPAPIDPMAEILKMIANL
jgi:hypothetical protein